MGMLITFILMWITGFVLYQNRKIEYIKWLSRYCFAIGCGGIADVFEKMVFPFFDNTYHNIIINQVIVLTTNAFYTIGYCFAFFAFTIYTLLYANVLKPEKKNKIIWILSAPSIISIILYPKITFPLFANPPMIFTLLSLWVIPYTVIGCTILFISIIRTKNPIIKRTKVISYLVTVPASLIGILTCYVYPGLGIKNMYQWNTLFVAIAFILLFSYLIGHGILGIKIQFERQKYNSSLKTVVSETALVNGMMKNEINKINEYAEKLKTLPKINLNVKEYNNIIQESTNHILEMVKRIREQTEDIVIEKSIHSLTDMIEFWEKTNRIELSKKEIEIVKNYNTGNNIYIWCDQVHLQETINNIAKNAIEAMKDRERKIITFEIIPEKKFVILSIRDNGVGIPKDNLARIFDPFFSTKKLTNNFGLGLTYCYNVMQKHKGSIEISSEEKVGTTVYLKLPFNQPISNKTLFFRRVANG